jgi:alpha-glucan,water dikinase
VDKGMLIDQLRKKILKGNIESKVSKQLKNKKYFSVERIQRKKRDIMQILSKHKHTVIEEQVEVAPKQLTVLDLFTKSLQKKDGCEVLSKKLFKFGGKQILAISTKVLNKSKVYLATNHMEPLILHWSLAKKAGEWKVKFQNCFQ